MALKQLNMLLKGQFHRTTLIEDMPRDDTPEWAQQVIKDKNAQYAREAEREERRQRRQLRENNASND